MYENWGFPESKRKNANAKQNTKGPARSASSMIWESTLEAGLRTASDFWRMCDGLMPSSSIRLGSPSRPPVPNASHHLPEPARMLPVAMFMLPDMLPMLPMAPA